MLSYTLTLNNTYLFKYLFTIVISKDVPKNDQPKRKLMTDFNKWQVQGEAHSYKGGSKDADEVP